MLACCSSAQRCHGVLHTMLGQTDDIQVSLHHVGRAGRGNGLGRLGQTEQHAPLLEDFGFR